jgi:predicted kinase
VFDKLVEQKIREAQRAGEFDRLEGSGRPVNLDAYFSAPEELRAGFAVLKNAGVLPEEAQLRADINGLRERLDACTDPQERERLTRSLNELTLKYSLMVERYRGTARRTE